MPQEKIHNGIIAHYAKEHVELLRKPNHYLGGWISKGKVYLDIAVNKSARHEAMYLARKHNQLKIYDVVRGMEIETDGS